MLELRRTNALVFDVAADSLGSENVTSVVSSLTTDSKGQEALRIVITIPPGAEKRIVGASALNTLKKIQDELQKEGEMRFPMLEYARGRRR